jgi:hypothetical protein
MLKELGDKVYFYIEQTIEYLRTNDLEQSLGVLTNVMLSFMQMVIVRVVTFACSFVAFRFAYRVVSKHMPRLSCVVLTSMVKIGPPPPPPPVVVCESC